MPHHISGWIHGEYGRLEQAGLDVLRGSQLVDKDTIMDEIKEDCKWILLKEGYLEDEANRIISQMTENELAEMAINYKPGEL